MLMRGGAGTTLGSKETTDLLLQRLQETQLISEVRGQRSEVVDEIKMHQQNYNHCRITVSPYTMFFMVNMAAGSTVRPMGRMQTLIQSNIFPFHSSTRLLISWLTDTCVIGTGGSGSSAGA